MINRKESGTLAALLRSYTQSKYLQSINPHNFQYEKFISSATNLLSKLRDTKYITCDINERLLLIKTEVSDLREELINARDAKSADECLIKLKAAQEEYSRVLRISRDRKTG